MIHAESFDVDLEAVVGGVVEVFWVQHHKRPIEHQLIRADLSVNPQTRRDRRVFLNVDVLDQERGLFGVEHGGGRGLDSILDKDVLEVGLENGASGAELAWLEANLRP